MKHVALLGLLSLAVPSAELPAQSRDSSLQATLESINQILYDHPNQDPGVLWQRQRLDVKADQLVLTISTQGLDGSIQAVRWTAKTSDVQRAVVGPEGQILFPCRTNTPCAQLWDGLDEGHPLPKRSAVLTVDAWTASEMAGQLLSACQRLSDLVAGIGAPADAQAPSDVHPH